MPLGCHEHSGAGLVLAEEFAEVRAEIEPFAMSPIGCEASMKLSFEGPVSRRGADEEERSRAIRGNFVKRALDVVP